MRIRVAVFVVALLVRIAAIEAARPAQLTFGDARDYVAAAESLCSKGVYPERGNLPFFRAPGLPFFIAAVTACEPARTRAILYALAVCDALTVLVIFLIARSSLIAAAIATFHPLFIAGVTDIRSEPLFMLLLTLSILYLLRGRAERSGMAVALAALTRPSALLCIPLFALFARRRGIALVIAATLTLAPWVARNYLRFGELIVVNDAAGFNFWRGAHPELIDAYDSDSPEEWRRKAEHFETKTVFETEALVYSRASSPAARSRIWFDLGLENLKRDPAAFARFTGKKAWIFWRPWLNPIEYPTALVLMSGAFYIALYLAFLWTGVRPRTPIRGESERPAGEGARRSTEIAVVIFFVAMWLSHLPYQVTMRFRVPLTDPLLIVLASQAFRPRDTITSAA